MDLETALIELISNQIEEAAQEGLTIHPHDVIEMIQEIFNGWKKQGEDF